MVLRHEKAVKDWVHERIRVDCTLSARNIGPSEHGMTALFSFLLRSKG